MDSKIENNLNTYNWFNYGWFYKHLVGLGYTKFAEIGVWKGHSISFLAGLLKDKSDVEIYAVDLFDETYKYTPTDSSANANIRKQVEIIYQIYQENLKRTNTREMITDVKGTSWEMASKFQDEQLDVAFIDADHSYESVKKDVTAWFPKVRKGGILSGHDYVRGNTVAQAVNEMNTTLFKPNGLKLVTDKESIWYVKK